MPQKRMAARGQSAKLNKGPSLKKAPVAKSATKAGDKSKNLAKKAKASLSDSVRGREEITPPKLKTNGKAAAAEKIASAKAALKKETAAKPAVKAVKATVKEAAAVQKTEATKAKRGRKISIDISPNEAASALSGKWGTLYKKAEQIEAKPYNMKAVFEEKTAITHKVLGWGYILANRNDRLEVLFKDGIKYLISNYKP